MGDQGSIDRQVAAGRRRLGYITAAEVESFLARSDAAIIPVGPTEAHGVHLPLGCDCLVAEATAVLAAERADALIFPPFTYSWPGGTALLPGSVPFPAELVIEVLIALGKAAVAKGFRRIAFVSGHQPDTMVAALAARRLFEMTGVPVAFYDAWGTRTPKLQELAEPLRARDREDKGAFETSLLAAAVQVLGLERVAPVRMDLAAVPVVPLPESQQRLNRGGAHVGRYYFDLSQHIPKPRELLVEQAAAFLHEAGATLAEALEALREYGPIAAANAERLGHY